MRKSKKLYGSVMFVELVSILLSLAYVFSPLNVYLDYLSYLQIILLLTASIVFLLGILCAAFGRNAEKSEAWFHNCSIMFAAYEKSEAKVA